MGRSHGLQEVHAIETLTLLHELIEDLVDARIVINMPGLFRTSYKPTNFQDNIIVGANKKLVKRALSAGNNFYIRPEHKFVCNDIGKENAQHKGAQKPKDT